MIDANKKDIPYKVEGHHCVVDELLTEIITFVNLLV